MDYDTEFSSFLLRDTLWHYCYRKKKGLKILNKIGYRVCNFKIKYSIFLLFIKDNHLQ